MNLALERAEEIFYDNELTAEYLDARNVSFKENDFIKNYSDIVAKSIYENIDDYSSKDDVKEHISVVFKNKDFINYIYDEVIKILEKDYSLSFEKISI